MNRALKKVKKELARKAIRKEHLIQRKINKMIETEKNSVENLKTFLNDIYMGNSINEKQFKCDILIKYAVNCIKRLSKNKKDLNQKYKEYLSTTTVSDYYKFSFNDFKRFMNILYKDSIYHLKNCKVDIDNMENTILYKNIQNVMKEYKKYENYFGRDYLDNDTCFLEYMKKRALIGYIIDVYERLDIYDDIGILTYDETAAVIGHKMSFMTFYDDMYKTKPSFKNMLDINVLKKDFEFVYPYFSYSNLLYYLDKSEKYIRIDRRIENQCLDIYRISIWEENLF